MLTITVLVEAAELLPFDDSHHRAERIEVCDLYIRGIQVIRDGTIFKRDMSWEMVKLLRRAERDATRADQALFFFKEF